MIDPGAALTKIVVGELGLSGQIEIKKVRIEKTSEAIWAIDNYVKKPKAAGSLRQLLKGCRRNDAVILMINDKQMQVASFTFPLMTSAEVVDAMVWQMRLPASEDLKDWQIDFVARKRIRWFEHLGVDEESLDVLGVAVRKDRLGCYSRIFKLAGCRLTAVVPYFYGFDSLMNPEAERPILIIDMGEKETRFFYYYQAALRENHRLELEAGWDGETYLKQIIKAAEQILDFPLGRDKAAENGNIYLIGGESLHKGVLDYLTKGLNQEIRPADDLLEETEELNFPGQMSKAERCLMIPCLCGLIKHSQFSGNSGSLTIKDEMNLLSVVQGQKKKKKQRNWPNRKGQIIFAGLFLGLLTIYGLLVGLDRSCLNEIKQLETLIANKSGDQIVYANLANQKEVLEHRRLILESINKEKELPLQTMVEIHKVLPIDTRLSNYSFQEGHLLVSGTTRNKEEILQFKEKLEGVEVFKMINMVNTSRKEEISADNKQPAGEAEWEFTFDIQVLEV